MLVTLSGIVILVRLRQYSKAEPPMRVTGYPSNVDGIANLPLTEVLQSIIVASPLDTVYVKLPLVYSVAALASILNAPVSIAVTVSKNTATANKLFFIEIPPKKHKTKRILVTGILNSCSRLIIAHFPDFYKSFREKAHPTASF